MGRSLARHLSRPCPLLSLSDTAAQSTHWATVLIFCTPHLASGPPIAGAFPATLLCPSSQRQPKAMASIEVLSPRPMGQAASLDVTALNSLCSGSLDELLAAQQTPTCAGAPAAQLSPGRATGHTRSHEGGEGGIVEDPARATKLRAATEIVKKSWQYQVGGGRRHRGQLAAEWWAGRCRRGMALVFRLAILDTKWWQQQWSRQHAKYAIAAACILPLHASWFVEVAFKGCTAQ